MQTYREMMMHSINNLGTFESFTFLKKPLGISGSNLTPKSIPNGLMI